jgi:hypothetical protein
MSLHRIRLLAAVLGVLVCATRSAFAEPTITVDAGAGWTTTQYRFQEQDTSFAGAAADVRGWFGYRLGDFGVGMVGGVLLVPSLDSSWIAATKPEALTVAHAGIFGSWHVSPGLPLALGARLEAAYARVSGTSAAIADAASTNELLVSAAGGLIGFRAAYESAAPGPAVAAGIEVFGGGFRRQTATTKWLVPIGVMATVGFSWR